MNKDCIIMYAGCGQGHKKAALAIAQRFDFLCVDILDFAPSFIKDIYSKGYLKVSANLGIIWFLIFEMSKNIFF